MTVFVYYVRHNRFNNNQLFMSHHQTQHSGSHEQTPRKKTRRYLWIGLAALVLIAIVFALAKSGPKKTEFVSVERGTITQELSLTGRVKAVQHAELGLDRTGRVSWISAEVGKARPYTLPE